MIIFAALVAALLMLLAWTDLRHRRLPNGWVLTYGLLCPVGLLLQGAAASTWLGHAAVAAGAFLVLLGLFAVGGMGGGDVKLGTAVFAWAGPQSLLPALFLVGLAGLLLALAGLLCDRLLRASRLPATPITRRMVRAFSAKRGVPYGVALALGGLAILPAYLQ